MAYAKKKDGYKGGLQRLKEDIKAKTPRKLYVFFGEESYLKEYYRDELKKLIGRGGSDDSNIINMDGSGLKAEELEDAVDSLPFGSERKMIIIRDPDLSSGGAKMKEYYTGLFSDVPEYLCMVLYYESSEFSMDKRLNIYKALEKNACIVEFERAGGSELVRWLQRRFSSHGKRIAPGDCDYLLYISGFLMTNLITEVDKISSYCEGETVTKADIDAVASRVLEVDVFDLTDCIMSGDYIKGISILRDLLDDKNEPVALMSAIIRQTQRIYAASLAVKDGKGEDYLTNLYKFRSSYPARLLLKAVKGIEPYKAAKALDICCNADTYLKSNIPDQARTLELTLLKMAEAVR